MKRKKIHAPEKYGRLNIAGLNIRKIRKEKFPEMSQNDLSALVQLEGVPMSKNTIQRMESGIGAINDIQLLIFAKVLNVSVQELLDETIYQNNSTETYKQEETPLYAANKQQNYK